MSQGCPGWRSSPAASPTWDAGHWVTPRPRHCGSAAADGELAARVTGAGSPGNGGIRNSERWSRGVCWGWAGAQLSSLLPRATPPQGCKAPCPLGAAAAAQTLPAFSRSGTEAEQHLPWAPTAGQGTRQSYIQARCGFLCSQGCERIWRQEERITLRNQLVGKVCFLRSGFDTQLKCFSSLKGCHRSESPLTHRPPAPLPQPPGKLHPHIYRQQMGSWRCKFAIAWAFNKYIEKKRRVWKNKSYSLMMCYT